MANKSSICWDCAKACRKCPWSKDFKPVPGWDATPTKVYVVEGKYDDSFIVNSCPLFEKEQEYKSVRISAKELAFKLGGFKPRTIMRMPIDKLIGKCAALGIDLEVRRDAKGTRIYFIKEMRKPNTFIPLEMLRMFWKSSGYTGF